MNVFTFKNYVGCETSVFCFKSFNIFIFLVFVTGNVNCQSTTSNHHNRTNQLSERSAIVHLFEWKWRDIADECERFLAPKGFGGVQISPPSENLIIHLDDESRTWYERYQVMSYKLTTRSGNEEDFKDMTRRCNKVGVRFGMLEYPTSTKWLGQGDYLTATKRTHHLNKDWIAKNMGISLSVVLRVQKRIYADVVVNHMTGDNRDNIGTGGSKAEFKEYHYPAVPYTYEHFHYPHCGINNYNNATEVRDCELVGLKDLNQSMPYVQNKIVKYFNKLIRLGVAGLRIDAAKHMWPKDLRAIYKRLNNLNIEYGFTENTRPYIYQEVIYYGNEPITPQQYTALGDVTEFKVGSELKNVFRGNNALKWLVNWGEGWGLAPSETALVFIDNHDTQRDRDVLTFKESRPYKAAVAFMLAHPYGEPRVMSSYFFGDKNQGPPADHDGNLISPSINDDDTCGNGWVCEHRWRQIYQMVGFRNAARDQPLTNWWDNGSNQIAFSRGNRAFVAFNLERHSMDVTLQTNIPRGNYCDVITGKRKGDSCSGAKLTVDEKGFARVQIPSYAEDALVAIHVGKESALQKF